MSVSPVVSDDRDKEDEASEVSDDEVDEQDRMEQAQENAGNLFQTRLQRREKSAALMKQPKPFMTLQANARIPPPSSLSNVPLSNKGDPEKAIVDATKKLVNDGSITSSDKKQIDAEQKL